ncbi:hypothetical protein DL96DRAFT_1665961 [Flagelloscypha sp. PMI_526]|nr:hypothetical protein DL96DRAFT_1665961 [Flagelloscypha sp. PMI_526]
MSSRSVSLFSEGSSRVLAPETPKVELNDVEDRICSIFNEYTTFLKTSENLDTECRIAGGWVRDKLLGHESNDIDIAINNMMGEDLANRIKDFATEKGIETGTVAPVKSNPDQSKHLETAKLKLLGLELDLVNLRSEEYAENSRIPTGVTFGTPLEDALRRDMTINSMFYNIHTREVEDQTGKGLQDLRDGVIRTPLPPRQTFLDDPLRIVRCFRFASRYGFQLVPELSDSIKEHDIQDALIHKVTRERVGEEYFKMLKGRDPVNPMKLIHEHSLYDAIFGTFPPDIKSSLSGPAEPSKLALAAVSILRYLLDPSLYPSIILPSLHPTLLQAVKSDPTCVTRLYLGASLIPWRDVTYTDKKKKVNSAVEAAIKESLKIGSQSHLSDGVPALFAAQKIIGLPELAEARLKMPSERVAIGNLPYLFLLQAFTKRFTGLLLREKAVHNANTGSHWTSSILFSLLVELLPAYNLQDDVFDITAAAATIDIFNTFISKIEDLDLTDAPDAKPLLDGRAVVKVLDAPKPGPWTGKILADVVEWQLGHPQGSKEECEAWLKKRLDDGEIDLSTAGEPVNKRARTS